MGTPLYRFTSFQSFVDVIQSKQLTFVKPDSWDDTYEGYVYRLIYKSRNLDKLYDEIKKLDPGFNTSLVDLKKYVKNLYAQCWTQKSESDALWRINSHGNMAVRIEIDTEDIIKLSEVSRSTTAEKVEYEEYLNLADELKKIIIPAKNSGITIFTPTKGITTKRKDFEHEAEVRLIHIRPPIGPINVVDDITAQTNKLKKIIELYSNNQIDKKTYNYLTLNPNPKKILKIPYNHIPKFIKSVMLHPQAPAWFNETLKKYCDLNNLNYLGKSKLYEKP